MLACNSSRPMQLENMKYSCTSKIFKSYAQTLLVQLTKYAATPKRPQGLSMREWRKGPGKRYILQWIQDSAINYMSKGTNFSNGFFGTKVSSWCNTTNGPPHIL